jgi:hypothetical protein
MYEAYEVIKSSGYALPWYSRPFPEWSGLDLRYLSEIEGFSQHKSQIYPFHRRSDDAPLENFPPSPEHPDMISSNYRAYTMLTNRLQVRDMSWLGTTDRFLGGLGLDLRNLGKVG